MNSAPQTPNDSAEDRLNHQRQSLKQSVTEAMQRYFLRLWTDRRLTTSTT